VKRRLAIVALACLSQAALAADPAANSDDDLGTKPATTVAEALAKIERSRVHQPPLDVRRKVAQRFGECLARIPGLHGKAITFLLSGKRSDGVKLADTDCFGKGLEAGGLDSVNASFPVHVMRSMVADGLVRVEFHSHGPTDFSAVAPLDHPPKDEDETVPAAKERTIADKLGECAARVSPEGIRQLALAEAASKQELAQIHQLVPTFAQCLPPGVQLSFSAGVLRDSSVLGYARLAFTQAAE